MHGLPIVAKLQTTRSFVGMAVPLLIAIGFAGVLAARWAERERRERLRYERSETELIVSKGADVSPRLFKAGKDLRDAVELSGLSGERVWLRQGNYFLRIDRAGKTLFYPVPIIGYRGGPDAEGAFAVTIRASPRDFPPPPLPNRPEFCYIPSGHFLIGNRLNMREPHYVWLPAFFISPFEITNKEFSEFLDDAKGYANDANWTEAGKRWKAQNASQNTALLGPADAEFTRFGQPDQPVVRVNWYEAAAYSRWLTRKTGNGRWVYALPTEAEWEKAARGPDSFDYGLGNTVSDEEVGLYNWKKNPGAGVTVVGIGASQSIYHSNRYGLYHMTGNVSEWTASLDRPYDRERPYADDDRNHEEADGQRVVRGGSWYSASVALLQLAYRDSFQPGLSNHDLGFRIVVRMLP